MVEKPETTPTPIPSVNTQENGTKNTQSEKDPTISKNKIPQTGIQNTVITVSILSLLLVAIIAYVKYKKLKK